MINKRPPIMFEPVENMCDEVHISIVSNIPYTMSESVRLAKVPITCISPSEADQLLETFPDLLIISDVGFSLEDKARLVACLSKLKNVFSIRISENHFSKDDVLSEYVDSTCYLTDEGKNSFNQLTNTLIESVVLSGMDSTDFADVHHHFKNAGLTKFKQQVSQGYRRALDAMTKLLPACISEVKSVVIVVSSGPDFRMDEYEEIFSYAKEMLPLGCNLMVTAKLCEEYKNSDEICVSAFING